MGEEERGSAEQTVSALGIARLPTYPHLSASEATPLECSVRSLKLELTAWEYWPITWVPLCPSRKFRLVSSILGGSVPAPFGAPHVGPRNPLNTARKAS